MANHLIQLLQRYQKDIVLPIDQVLHLASGSIMPLPSDRIDARQDPQFLFWLQEGLIKVVTFDELEGECIKFLVKEKQFFGELALAKVQMPDYYAVALRDSKISYFNIDSVHELMEQHADLNLEMLLLISSRIEQLEDRLDHLAHTDSKTRVVDFIQDFAKEFGQQIHDQLVVGNFLKNKEIAQLTYTSRQTVNAVMNQLKRSGQIDFNAEYIFLKNRTLQLV